MKLSPSQLRLLLRIVSEMDARTSRNVERWGEPLRWLSLAPGGHEVRTLWSLERAGLVEVRTSRHRGEEWVHGPFGRSGGYNRHFEYVTFQVRPTVRGRDVLARS